MNRLLGTLILLVSGMFMVLVAIAPSNVLPTYAQQSDSGIAPMVITGTPQEPTAKPTDPPTAKPTDPPTSEPPTAKPTDAPTSEPPTTQPTDAPTSEPPTTQPTNAPTSEATDEPSKPTRVPTTVQPTRQRPRDGSGGGDGNIRIVKEVRPGKASVGDSIEFVLTVTNERSRSTNVSVIDNVQGCFQVRSATTSWGTAFVEGNGVRVEIGDLFKGDVVTIRIQATVVCQPDAGSNFNTAIVRTGSDNEIEDSSTIWLPIEQLLATPTLTPTATLVVPTPTVPFTPTATIQLPSPTPTPTMSTVPRKLPRTGEAEGMSGEWNVLLLLVGIASITTGLFVNYASRVRKPPNGRSE